MQNENAKRDIAESLQRFQQLKAMKNGAPLSTIFRSKGGRKDQEVMVVSSECQTLCDKDDD